MVLWHADDRVSIFNKYTYNQQYRFTGNTGANSGSFTKVPNDDFITGNILRDNKFSVSVMHSLAAETYHFLMKSGAEPGTAEAYRFFLISVETLYKVGAAVWLNKLGYKYEKVQ